MTSKRSRDLGILVSLAAAGLLLIICAANMANLSLAVAADRAQDSVIRTALGASSSQLVTLFLTESVLLAVLGGSAGLLITIYGVRVLPRLIPTPLPSWVTLDVNWAVFAFNLLASVAVGILFGLAPALFSLESNLTDTLRQGTRASMREGWLRNGLIVAEVSVCFTLLVGAGLLLKNFDRLRHVSPGFSSQHLLTFKLAPYQPGKNDEAAEAFSNALRLNPDSAKAHAGLATILIGKGELDEAHKHYETALKMDPNNAEYHSGYAYLLEQLGHDDQAAAECEAAVRLAPKSAQAHHSYGAFLEKHGKLDEATAQYREAVRADPGLVDAQIDFGTALLEKGDLSEAKAHLQTASKLDPKLAQPHNYLGKIFMREGDVSSAIAQFEEALRLHPDFPEAEENLRMAKGSDNASLTLSPR